MCSACPARWLHRSEVIGPAHLSLPWLGPGQAYQVRRTWAVIVLEVAAQIPAPFRLVPTGIDVTLLCQHGGLCVDEEDKHYCHCQAGYTGSYCEDEVDECSPNPCQNGATCTDYLGGFSCKVWAVLKWGAAWGRGYWHECCRRRALELGPGVSWPTEPSVLLEQGVTHLGRIHSHCRCARGGGASSGPGYSF